MVIGDLIEQQCLTTSIVLRLYRYWRCGDSCLGLYFVHHGVGTDLFFGGS